jgi:deoxyribodipyrimidine photo-lyase
MLMQEIAICWFRRDLRLTDNAALYHALHSGYKVLPIFIFDTEILNRLEDKADKRVAFIHAALHDMQATLVQLGSTLHVAYGVPANVFEKLIGQYSIKAVFTNHDYEPYAKQRDGHLQDWLLRKGIVFNTYKDQVLLEKNEVLKDDGLPYTVFTPYSRKWKAVLNGGHLQPYETEKVFHAFLQQPEIPIPTLQAMNFEATENLFPGKMLNEELVKKYAQQRDIPALPGTSKLGVHLRFGTISIRQLARQAMPLSETYVNELIWRDFYHMILWHFPQVGQGKAFKPLYDQIVWRHSEQDFERWCQGNTGYPIVDAGMRELNTTGFMHNRVRMIVASFLTKHLLLDWRLGEAYFAAKLLDFDLAANNGGWQWAAGSGCDAAPYFRIFNPYLQTQKFDPQLAYIRKWVPEFQEFSYPKPIVQHEVARKRCLEVYSAALKNTE